MGPGGAVDAARAAMQGNALRAWGEAIARVVDDLALPSSATGVPSLGDGVATLRPVPRELVHSTGWELRNAFVWRNDDRCLQRAVFGALSLAEREAGGNLRSAVGGLAREDALASAMTITYSPRFANVRLHTAALARTTDDELLVVDHLLADADDGVLAFDEWMRRSGARTDTTAVLSPLRQPPWSLHTGPGIPVQARPRRSEEWVEFADHLSASWRESADRGLPAYERIVR